MSLILSIANKDLVERTLGLEREFLETFGRRVRIQGSVRASTVTKQREAVGYIMSKGRNSDNPASSEELSSSLGISPSDVLMNNRLSPWYCGVVGYRDHRGERFFYILDEQKAEIYIGLIKEVEELVRKYES